MSVNHNPGCYCQQTVERGKGRRKGGGAGSQIQGLCVSISYQIVSLIRYVTITYWNPIHYTPQTVILSSTIRNYAIVKNGQSSGGQHASYTRARADFIERISAWHSIILRDGKLTQQRLDVSGRTLFAYIHLGLLGLKRPGHASQSLRKWVRRYLEGSLAGVVSFLHPTQYTLRATPRYGFRAAL